MPAKYRHGVFLESVRTAGSRGLGFRVCGLWDLGSTPVR